MWNVSERTEDWMKGNRIFQELPTDTARLVVGKPNLHRAICRWIYLAYREGRKDQRSQGAEKKQRAVLNRMEEVCREIDGLTYKNSSKVGPAGKRKIFVAVCKIRAMAGQLKEGEE